MTKKNLPNRLKEARESRGWTKTYVQETLGLGRNSLYGYEKGTIEPDIETLKSMAKLYGLSISFLVGDDYFDNYRVAFDSNLDDLTDEQKQTVKAVIDSFRKINNK